MHSVHLAPLAGRGRIASPDAIRVRGVSKHRARGDPLHPHRLRDATSPRKRGEVQRRLRIAYPSKSSTQPRQTHCPPSHHSAATRASTLLASNKRAATQRGARKNNSEEETSWNSDIFRCRRIRRSAV